MDLWHQALLGFPTLAVHAELLRRPFEDCLAAGGVAHPADLLLALACRRRLAEGVALFERHIIPEAAEAARRVEGADVDEVLQRFRLCTLMGERLGSYSGRGSLAAWSRAVAVRLGLNERVRRRTEPLEDVLPALDESVEVTYLLRAHAAQFRTAFREALATLTPRERAMLRLNGVEGVSLEAIGKHLQLHKSSVSRQLAKVRTQLLLAVRQRLQTVLPGPVGDLASLNALLASRVSISLPLPD
ncbi:MAG: sigma-70 family RNA polymerase sigma factor [Myxococcaceae bacterium]|nr:sigma-70 family RNA polymerase sigma factor [Myxococcaceae bacterium]